jgi:tRNA-specific 2-thiouridylase
MQSHSSHQTHTKPLKVIVGMSGGVDSSVSAHFLKTQAYNVQGLFMKNWEGDYDDEFCPVAEDFQDAQSVCDELEIPLHARNFAKQYWDNVFEYFLSEYRAGRTPNPDVMCNKEIKFKVFLEYALRIGADYIATGHYARVEKRDGLYRLLKAKDLNKDQTYFLYTLGQKELSKTIFPLQDITKPEVREIATKAGFINHDKKDSTGICFIGERRFKDFLSQYLPAQPGDICTPEGKNIGKHDGLMYYTLGQRQGLGIGGARDSSGEPWYVVGKDLETNTLYVAQGHNHPLMFSAKLEAIQLHWVIRQQPANLPLKCHAKTRYRQDDQACTITWIDDDRCEVIFDQPQRAVTPGQSVVFYQDDECLGGGIIEHVDTPPISQVTG